LAIQFLSQRDEEEIGRLADPSPDYNPSWIQEHQAALQSLGKMDHIMRNKLRILEEFACGAPVISFEPQSRAHPL
jgi:hypothetical protein